MQEHPVDGARIILEGEDELNLAATVAYEHHVMLDGGGYPAMHYSRECALASRLVHVCNVYDALSTTRPYRAAWPSEKTTAYLEERAGTEFDPDLVSAFLQMLREGEARIRVLTDDATGLGTKLASLFFEHPRAGQNASQSDVAFVARVLEERTIRAAERHHGGIGRREDRRVVHGELVGHGVGVNARQSLDELHVG